MHADIAHTSVGAHAVPHAPQFAGSLVRSAQTPAPQSMSPPAHTHAPPTQSRPMQLVPHAPQLRGSVVVSTHALLQSICGATHMPTHMLFEQD